MEDVQAKELRALSLELDAIASEIKEISGVAWLAGGRFDACRTLYAHAYIAQAFGARGAAVRN